MAENDSVVQQVQGLDRINRSLLATVEAINSENVQPSGNNVEMERLKSENKVLRERVHRLNQSVFLLKEERDKLNDALATHAKNVLSEHNYNL